MQPTLPPLIQPPTQLLTFCNQGLSMSYPKMSINPRQWAIVGSWRGVVELNPLVAQAQGAVVVMGAVEQGAPPVTVLTARR